MQASQGVLAGEPALPYTTAAEAGFFSHHGLWAPGVRLFRNLGFRVKAALIALAFLVPLAVLLAQNLLRSHAEIGALEREIAGAEIIDHFAPIQQALADMRNGARAAGAGFVAAAPVIDSGRRALDAAIAELADHLKERGDPLALGPKFRALQASASGLGDKPDTKSVEAVLARAREMSVAVGNRSGLILDADLVDLHLVLIYGEEMPRLAEALGQLRGWGTAALAGQRADAQALHRTVGWTARADAQLASIRDKLAIVSEQAPERTAKLPLDWLNGAEAYIKQAQKVFQADAQVEAAAWFALGSQQVESAYKAQAEAMPVLVQGLNARVDALRLRRLLDLSLCGAFLLLGAYLFHSFFLVMHGGLLEVRRHMEAMTTGDLTQSPQPWGQDELAQLMSSMAAMQESLRRMVARVRASSDDIVHSSGEIAAGALDLSARTEQTAASLEQTASAMEQISATVKHTAEYAQQATEIADHNAEVAQRGGAVIAQMVRTMEDIHASSNRIGDIIGVIDGIAFQTNILALNAAVEAARAGEAGRGFAVVAAEVRALAQRSAGAAREIKGLIGASVEQVEGGTRVVREAGATMQDIVAGAGRVKGLLDDIATGAREQSQGVGQVGAAVQELDRSTQQNAALVEQTAAASSALKALATALAGQVANFRLPGGR